MVQVDVDDDTIWRWAIRHYRFDSARSQRRNVVVAAYDDIAEYERELDLLSSRIRAEILADTRSNTEHVSGTVMHPGYQAAQARGHAVRRAVNHGADPRPLLSDGPLPTNMAVFGVDDDGGTFFYGGVPREPSAE